jgi:hypothetical protein
MSESKGTKSSAPSSDAGSTVSAAFSEAFQRYFQSIYEAYVPWYRQVEQLARESYKSAQEPQSDYSKLLSSYQTSWQSLAEARKDLAQRYEDAYRQYLRALQSSFAAVDVGTLSPASLCAVGQTLQIASLAASCTRGGA